MESSMDVPKGLLKEEPNFSLDIGGTLAKLAYIDGKNNSEDVTTIHLKYMTKDRLDEMIEFVHKTFAAADGKAMNWENKHLVMTGVGGNQWAKKLKDNFGNGCTNDSEMDCFIKTLIFLNEHVTREKLLEEMPLPGEMQADDKQMAKFADALGLADEMVNGTEEDDDTDEDIFPCILFMMGSGFAVMQIEKDGSMEMLDINLRGGRTLLGLGSLLTGAKSYDELVDLAEKGTNRSVCTLTGDVVSRDVNDLYSKIPDNISIYSFGKCVNKEPEDFHKEDLAAALLEMTFTEISQEQLTNVPLIAACKRVLLCGNFTARQYVKDGLTKWTNLRKNIFKQQFGHIQHSFVKNGGFFGAIGALLRNSAIINSK